MSFSLCIKTANRFSKTKTSAAAPLPEGTFTAPARRQIQTNLLVYYTPANYDFRFFLGGISEGATAPNKTPVAAIPEGTFTAPAHRQIQTNLLVYYTPANYDFRIFYPDGIPE